MKTVAPKGPGLRSPCFELPLQPLTPLLHVAPGPIERKIPGKCSFDESERVLEPARPVLVVFRKLDRCPEAPRGGEQLRPYLRGPLRLMPTLVIERQSDAGRHRSAAESGLQDCGSRGG